MSSLSGKSKTIRRYSNPTAVKKAASRYLGSAAASTLKLSTKREKKYMVQNPKTGRWTHFGQMGYEDYTKHHDKKRRKNYLTRSRKIKGNWRGDKFSANNLSIHILW